MDDALDVKTLSDRLVSYLRAELASPTLDLAGPLTRLQGGYETAIYRFELDGAPEELSRPLVLRLYPRFYGTGNATWESTVQNVLAEAGYPVARAHIVCTDMSLLGGAFFIMDHLPGQPLAVAPPERMPGLLGRAHAKLHSIAPEPLFSALADAGIAEHDYRLASRDNRFRDGLGRLPWLDQSISWLLENRPPEPERMAVCHGDFHPLNILYADGKITGVLDWGGFAIADPAFDVGNTIVLLTIACKHVAATMEGYSSVDWHQVAGLYLAAYRDHRSLDETNVDYYRVRRCVLSLAQGAEGQKIWQHPPIVRELLAYIREVTGIDIRMPA